MRRDANPYESPNTGDAEEAATGDTEEADTEVRRPAFGTILVGIWTVEAIFKTCVLIYACWQGFNPVQFFVQNYHAWNRIAFLLGSSFLIIETIGPWIAIYYLTGRRARTIPFDSALIRILKLSGGIAIGASLGLMLYLEITATLP